MSSLKCYNYAMPKTRLDLLLVARGLVPSRSLAQRLVMAGQVRVDDQVILKPATSVDSAAHLHVDSGPRFVSRGGEKLEAALQAFPIKAAGKVCADIGASTGGFTDCLIQHGAVRVYAIDVGQGILDWKLRNHPAVVVMENTNARNLPYMPEPIALITIDASFISLKILLPVISGWFETAGEVIALIKPQFEAGRAQASRGKGVIRDPAVHAQVLREILQTAASLGYGARGLLRSPLVGPKGNVEFLAWLVYPGRSELPADAIDRATEI